MPAAATVTDAIAAADPPLAEAPQIDDAMLSDDAPPARLVEDSAPGETTALASDPRAALPPAPAAASAAGTHATNASDTNAMVASDRDATVASDTDATVAVGTDAALAPDATATQVPEAAAKLDADEPPPIVQILTQG